MCQSATKTENLKHLGGLKPPFGIKIHFLHQYADMSDRNSLKAPKYFFVWGEVAASSSGIDKSLLKLPFLL